MNLWINKYKINIPRKYIRNIMNGLFEKYNENSFFKRYKLFPKRFVLNYMIGLLGIYHENKPGLL